MSAAGKDLTKLWRSQQVQGLELFKAHLYTRYFPRHMHENFTVCVCDAGEGLVECRGEQLHVRPGDMLLINPEEVHAGGAAPKHSWQYRVMYLSPELMRELQGHLHFFKTRLLHSPKLAQTFRQAFAVCEQGLGTKEQEGFLQLFIAELLQTVGETIAAQTEHVGLDASIGDATEKPRVWLVREYIQEHYFETILVPELANMVGLSTNYLIRMFKRTMGLTPHAYQMQVRLVHAKQALAKHTPIAEVALETGFFDQSHLNRCFKRIFGVTPKQYQST